MILLFSVSLHSHFSKAYSKLHSKSFEILIIWNICVDTLSDNLCCVFAKLLLPLLILLCFSRRFLIAYISDGPTHTSPKIRDTRGGGGLTYHGMRSRLQRRTPNRIIMKAVPLFKRLLRSLLALLILPFQHPL